MRRVFLYFFFFFLLASCSKEPEKPPITEEQMTELLLDMYLAEAVVEKEKWHLRDRMELIYLEHIAATHGMKTEEIHDAVKWLQRHRDYAHAVYKRLVIKLKEIEQSGTGKNTKHDKKK